MSIADHFAQRSDAGFVRTYDARAARRQFHVSLALVVVLALAALALGLLARSEPAGAANPLAEQGKNARLAETLLDIGS